MNILITGATSGIGLALTEYYLQQSNPSINLDGQKTMGQNDKNQVFAIGRNAEKLAYLDKLGAVAIPCDLTDKNQVNNLAEQLSRQTSRIDLAILNAGNCLYVEPGQFSTEPFEKSWQLNVMSMLNCIEILMPLLQTNQMPKAHLALMGSLASEFPFTRSAAYGATKAAVAYLANSLRVDYRDSLNIHLIQPGFVKTPLTAKNDFDMPFLMSTEQAVNAITQGISNNRKVIYFPKRFAIPLKLLGCLPMSVQHWLACKMS